MRSSAIAQILEAIAQAVEQIKESWQRTKLPRQQARQSKIWIEAKGRTGTGNIRWLDGWTGA